jgi:uncharacterized protein YndB with AHSA1/START domain
MEDTIVVEIDIAASPERIFDAWTDPKQLLTWWGDDATYRGTSWERDLRVGGKWRCEGKSASGKPYAVWGEYTRVERPGVLAFTWIHDWDTGPDTHVLIELSRVADGTHLKLTHSGFAKESTRDDHRNGWGRVLGWLQRYLENR